MLIGVPRPVLPRHVCCRFEGRGFRPIGQRPCAREAVEIALDELEALRLADVEGLYQDAAAGRMGVSRQTYARILGRARTAVAQCLFEGRTLLVSHGPVVESSPPPSTCPVHGGPRRHGRSCRCDAGGELTGRDAWARSRAGHDS